MENKLHREKNMFLTCYHKLNSAGWLIFKNGIDFFFWFPIRPHLLFSVLVIAILFPAFGVANSIFLCVRLPIQVFMFGVVNSSFYIWGCQFKFLCSGLPIQVFTLRVFNSSFCIWSYEFKFLCLRLLIQVFMYKVANSSFYVWGCQF